MLELDFAGVCLLGFGGALLGLCGLLARRAPKNRVILAAPLVLAVLATVAAVFGQGAGTTWLAPVLLAGGYGLFLAVRSPVLCRLGTAALPVLRRPDLSWAVVLVASPVLAAWWAWWCSPDLSAWSPSATVAPARKPVLLRSAPAGRALTDAGRAVPLYGPAERLSDTDLQEGETWLADLFRCDVIRTGPASLECNSHGWVFAAGQFWVPGEQVEAILNDNGYRKIVSPRPGDLVLYRRTDGAVQHSGIVRLVSGPDFILVESLWTRVGCFLHAVDRQCFAAHFEFYHSPRTGHKLAGVAEAPAGGRPVEKAAAGAAGGLRTWTGSSAAIH